MQSTKPPSDLRTKITNRVALFLTGVAGYALGDAVTGADEASVAKFAVGIVSGAIALALFFWRLILRRIGAGGPGAPSLALLLTAGAALGISVTIGGCATPRSVPADDFDPLLTRVLDYAEPRLATEPGLPEPDRKGLLMDAAILRRAFDAAMQREPSPTAFEALYPAMPAPPDG